LVEQSVLSSVCGIYTENIYKFTSDELTLLPIGIGKYAGQLDKSTGRSSREKDGISYIVRSEAPL
jgi:hypothetical protein